MELIKVDPKLRLNRITFDPKKEYTDHVIDIGHYECPHCLSILEFKTTDFYRHFNLRHSNLKQDIQKLFDQFHGGSESIWEPFLDFECYGCASPVRIYYEPWEFAMGCYGYTVIEIIEVMNWEKK